MDETTLSQTDEQLLEQIGGALLADTKGVFPPSFEAKLAAANEWLKEKKEVLCQIVCGSEALKKLLSEGNYGRELTILVIDILEHHAVQLLPVPPAATGALFCRYSYYKLCGS
jgi:hypothetical protein